LLGRDRLLAEEIRPRLKEGRGFVLTGTHGAGKTAILEWISVFLKKDVTTISAEWTVKEMLVQMCLDWAVEVRDDEGATRGKTKWQVAWMERALLKETDKWLIVDDIQKVTPTKLRRLKLFRDRVRIIAAGVPPFRQEELKRLLWGLPAIQVKPLPTDVMNRIAIAAAPVLESRTPIGEAVHASRGIPGQLIHALRGEVTPEARKVSGEEIDLSPLILIGLAGVMITRYVAIGLESTSLYMLGGLGMGIGLIVRFYLFRGMEAQRR